jgi:hypothetical protein
MAEERRFTGAGYSMQENQNRIGLGHATKPNALGYIPRWPRFPLSRCCQESCDPCIFEANGVNTAGGGQEYSQADNYEGTASKQGFHPIASASTLHPRTHAILTRRPSIFISS